MKIESRSLKSSFDFTTYEMMGDYGRALTIVTHDSLEDVIHNQVKGVAYDYEICSSSPEHSVVKCVMKDDKGRRVVGIGESLPATLTTHIANCYPTLTATQRAFDRAAIRYLDLPGKVLSNMEISAESVAEVVDPVQPTTQPSVQPATGPVVPNVPMSPAPSNIPVAPPKATTGIVSTVVEDEEQVNMGSGNVVIEDDVLFEDDSEPIEIEDTPVDIEEDTEVAIDEPLPFDVGGSDDALSKVGGYVITMGGRYATAGLTIKEIYDKDPSWLTWVAEKYTAYSDIGKKDKAQVQEFLALVQ